jgi:uncharacterized membrane protein
MRFRRIRSAALAMAAVAAALGVLSGAASADLKLCNTTASRVGVAIGYRDGTGGWISEGWWTIPSHTCETLFKGSLPHRLWYVHAIDYDRGGEWAGQSFLCTTDKAFTIRGVQDCGKRGYKRTGFFEVDTQEAGDWTIRLTDPGEGSGTAK